METTDKERIKIIRIAGSKIYLTENMYVEIARTNLGGQPISFSSAQDIYLEAEIICYEKANQSITFKITDYQPQHIEQFKLQTPKSVVSYVHFLPFSWNRIKRYLGSYTEKILKKEGIVIDDNLPDTKDETERSRFQNFELIRNYAINKPMQPFAHRDPVIEEVVEETKIRFEDAEFNKGFVRFRYRSKKLNIQHDHKINNSYLLPEFDAVKSYFTKVLGGKKYFNIKITFTLTDNAVTGIVTTSPEIESINEHMIDSIKFQRVAKFTSSPLGTQNERALFTSDELFELFDDDVKAGNLFNQSEEDILRLLIQTRKIRNALHLKFLSDAQHPSKQKLRFTLNPLFGYLFFIEGETKHHFCWELLSSHATYLWSFDKTSVDLATQSKRIEETIKIIRSIGREEYRNRFKHHSIDNDLSFHIIEHSNIMHAGQESFAEWQQRLKERLV